MLEKVKDQIESSVGELEARPFSVTGGGKEKDGEQKGGLGVRNRGEKGNRGEGGLAGHRRLKTRNE